MPINWTRGRVAGETVARWVLWQWRFSETELSKTQKTELSNSGRHDLMSCWPSVREGDNTAMPRVLHHTRSREKHGSIVELCDKLRSASKWRTL